MQPPQLTTLFHGAEHLLPEGGTPTTQGTLGIEGARPAGGSRGVSAGYTAGPSSFVRDFFSNGYSCQWSARGVYRRVARGGGHPHMSASVSRGRERGGLHIFIGGEEMFSSVAKIPCTYSTTKYTKIFAFGLKLNIVLKPKFHK